MATVNNYLSAIGATTIAGNHAIDASVVDSPVIKRRFIDTSTYNMAATEYYKIFHAPTDCIVRGYVVVETVEGATATVDISIVADTDTTASSPVVLLNDQDIDGDAGDCGVMTAKATTAASAICIMPNHALDAAKFWVVCEFIPLLSTD